MHYFRTYILAAISFTCLDFAHAAPYATTSPLEAHDGINLTTFEHAATGVKVEFVTNSGVCETTAGVNQYSGYVSVGKNMSMWFWFFEARNNPETAPLAIWFNGGPGSSSMIGLFVENGPCHFVDNETTPSLNPHSFNNYANMLYVDQPIGAGFSYGSSSINSSIAAAPDVWNLLQAFYALFPAYSNRDFGIFTESYGGHYGPALAEYILHQNSAISNGSIHGKQINLIALGINNGLIDPIIQEKSYVDFALNNSYKPIINASEYSALSRIYNTSCAPQLMGCAATGLETACLDAEIGCGDKLEQPLFFFDSGITLYDFDAYDIRQPSSAPYPPSNYVEYLRDPSILEAIGAKCSFSNESNIVYDNFFATGDHSRTSLPQISNIIKSGVQVVLWAGDADFECNWFGVQSCAEALNFPGQDHFRSAPLTAYHVNGTQGGTFKTQGNLSFLRVFNSGHVIPYWQPILALQVFEQTMKRQPLSST